MQSFERSVKTLRDSTALICRITVREDNEIVICKLKDRVSRAHYIVYQSKYLVNQSAFKRVPVLAEAAQVGNRLSISVNKKHSPSSDIKNLIKNAMLNDFNMAMKNSNNSRRQEVIEIH